VSQIVTFILTQDNPLHNLKHSAEHLQTTYLTLCVTVTTLPHFSDGELVNKNSHIQVRNIPFLVFC